MGDLPVAWISSDQDEDGVPDEADNCITVANPTQGDDDKDGIGNICHGDANGDGKIDAEDAMFIQRCIVRLISCDRTKNDLNGNGRLDAGDALLIMYRVGLLPGPSGLRGEAPDAQVFYVYTDHLNTPRVVTDRQNRVRWRWDAIDPFGANIANDDPDADRIRLAYPLRFPGSTSTRRRGYTTTTIEITTRLQDDTYSRIRLGLRVESACTNTLMATLSKTSTDMDCSVAQTCRHCRKISSISQQVWGT